MSVLTTFSTLPGLNEATAMLVECEEELQQDLAVKMVERAPHVNVNVRLVKKLPLTNINHDECDSRPRIDLVVFIINLTSELSFLSAEDSLKYLHPGFFLGKVCFMVTNARNGSVPPERLQKVRNLAASHHCQLLYAETTPGGITNAADRLLTILNVAAGLVPMTTALYLSHLSCCKVPSDIDPEELVPPTCV